MKPELQDVFTMYGDGFCKTHRLPMIQLKTMSAIETCRTASQGGHMDECDSCGHVRISYNSCRNRHCPKCQGLAKERWLLEREQDLLDTGYFHVVFTIPDSLNPLALRNQRMGLRYSVSGGGLSFDGNRWLQSKKKFFLPVKVLSQKFRGKFLAFL